MCSVRSTYHRVVVYLIIVFSLRPFTCKDLLQYFGKCKQVFFLLLVIVMDSTKSNLSVNFVEGIHGTTIRKLLSPITAFLYQDNTTGG